MQIHTKSDRSCRQTMTYSYIAVRSVLNDPKARQPRRRSHAQRVGLTAATTSPPAPTDTPSAPSGPHCRHHHPASREGEAIRNERASPPPPPPARQPRRRSHAQRVGLTTTTTTSPPAPKEKTYATSGPDHHHHHHHASPEGEAMRNEWA